MKALLSSTQQQLQFDNIEVEVGLAAAADEEVGVRGPAQLKRSLARMAWKRPVVVPRGEEEAMQRRRQRMHLRKERERRADAARERERQRGREGAERMQHCRQRMHLL